MSNSNTPRDEAELEAFLERQSPLSTAYDALEPVQPPEVLDGKILAMARGAGSTTAAKPAPPKPAALKAEPAKPAAADKPAAPRPAASPPPPAAKAPPERPVARDAGDDDDDDDDAPVRRRPRWLVPAALAASVLVAVGVGVSLIDGGSSEPNADRSNPLGSMFAKRARDRSEADKAAAEAVAREAEVVDIAPLPPPPVFEAEGPQIEDLDTAIALIRRELVMANQMAAIQEESRSAVPAAGSVADTAAPAPAAPPTTDTAAPGIVQPRDRRLAKILELYDGGNPDLAAASLEIFLRDFEDDPISQRILDAQPKATDVAVE
ncbi:MAG: hypothetical protein ABL989_06065 [Gammaproteobacteria bacterium]